MATGSNKNNNNSPRKSFGGNNHVHTISSRAWWHWGLVGLVIFGIIGFVVQMVTIDPAQVTLEQLRGLIIYAIILFLFSIVLGVLEFLRLRGQKK